jgi:hypothetical protein
MPIWTEKAQSALAAAARSRAKAVANHAPPRIINLSMVFPRYFFPLDRGIGMKSHRHDSTISH